MTTLDQSDAIIQSDVLEEFAWDPEVDVAQVGVSVVNGIVTLTGSFDSYARKKAAERATLHVKGVRAVANDPVVQVNGFGPRPDAEIASDAAAAIEARRVVPPGEVRIAVDAGRITLEGEMPWEFRRAAAERFVTNLRGVREIENRIAITPMPAFRADVKALIKRALVRNASVDSDRVQVEVDNDIVRLSGAVGSWSEKDGASRAAWRAKGTTRVVNEIIVEPAIRRWT